MEPDMPSFLNIYFSHESAYKLKSLGTGSTNVVKPTGEIKALRSGNLILVSLCNNMPFICIG